MKTNNLGAVIKHMTKEPTEEQKLKLATHKIELSSKKDILEQSDNGYAFYQMTTSNMTEIHKKLKMLVNYIDDMEKTAEAMGSSIMLMDNDRNEFASKAKALGIDADDIAWYKESEKEYSDLKSKYKEVTSRLNNFVSVGKAIRKM